MKQPLMVKLGIWTKQAAVTARDGIQSLRSVASSRVEGLKNYCKIHTSNGVYITHGSMKQIEASFPEDEFIRIHKSTIISVYSIKYLTGQEVCLDGDRYFPIGETFRDKVKNFVSVRLLAFA